MSSGQLPQFQYGSQDTKEMPPIALAYEYSVKFGAPVPSIPSTQKKDTCQKRFKDFYKKSNNSAIFPSLLPLRDQEQQNPQGSTNELTPSILEDMELGPLSRHFLTSPQSVDKFPVPSGAIPLKGWDDFHQRNEISKYPLFRIALCGEEALVKSFHDTISNSKIPCVDRIGGWFGEVIGLRVPTIRDQHRTCLVELVDIHCPTDIARYEIQRELDGFIIVIDPRRQANFIVATEYHRQYTKKLRRGGIGPHPRGFLAAARKSCRRNFGLVEHPAAERFSELCKLRYYEYNIASRSGPKSILRTLLQCIDRNQISNRREGKQLRRYGMDFTDPSIKAQLPKDSTLARLKHWLEDTEVPVPTLNVSIGVQRRRLLSVKNTLS